MNKDNSAKGLQHTPTGTKRDRSQLSPQTEGISRKRSTLAETANMTPLTHKDLDALYEKLITGMKTELATFATKAEIGQLVDRVEGLSRENQELRVEIEGLKKQNAGLLSTLDDFDAKIRRNRLIVRGLKPDKDADPRLGTEKFLLDLVGEGNKINVRQAFTLGANGMRSTVLVEMSSDYEADRVLASAGKLRNSGVSISRDLPPGMRKRANRMLRLRWEVKRASPGLSLKLRNDKLRINQHNFSWTDDRLESDGRNGVEVLKDITGVDFTKTIEEIVCFRRPLGAP
ncbi:Hypothetical protein NTJ_02257 [Nesidiocoris tenuis]|uniref:Uncharacterized protein n=1 Tax=Nesidiocoris tenuis TaxID=355587 RepID=A0ABN7AB02_9HEMI|nr:Hypothetical protein NTJ_02257 [Nesidiocoris tenuis]